MKTLLGIVLIFIALIAVAQGNRPSRSCNDPEKTDNPDATVNTENQFTSVYDYEVHRVDSAGESQSVITSGQTLLARELTNSSKGYTHISVLLKHKPKWDMAGMSRPSDSETVPEGLNLLRRGGEERYNALYSGKQYQGATYYVYIVNSDGKVECKHKKTDQFLPFWIWTALPPDVSLDQQMLASHYMFERYSTLGYFTRVKIAPNCPLPQVVKPAEESYRCVTALAHWTLRNRLTPGVHRPYWQVITRTREEAAGQEPKPIVIVIRFSNYLIVWKKLRDTQDQHIKSFFEEDVHSISSSSCSCSVGSTGLQSSAACSPVVPTPFMPSPHSPTDIAASILMNFL